MVKTKDLIKELSKESQKIRCITPYAILWKWFFVFSLIIIAILMTMSRPDLNDIIAMPMMLAELSLALATGLLSAIAACWLSTPDIKQQKWVVWMPFIPLVSLCGLIIYNIMISPLYALYSEELHISCAVMIFMVALIPAIAVIFLLKYNANTHNILFSIMSVISVAAFGYFCSRLICYKDNIEHILLWHYIPVVLFSIVAAIIGAKILRWK